MAQDDELQRLRAQSAETLRELEGEADWDFEERTGPAIHVHLPRERMPSVAEEAGAGLSPRARLIVAIVVAVLSALGATRL